VFDVTLMAGESIKEGGGRIGWVGEVEDKVRKYIVWTNYNKD